MLAVTEDVSWSAVACRAFEAKLAEIAARKEQRTMDDVIQRLRASQQKDEDEAYRDGHELGREWVTMTGDWAAEVGELKELAKVAERMRSRGEWESAFDTEGRSAYTARTNSSYSTSSRTPMETGRPPGISGKECSATSTTKRKSTPRLLARLSSAALPTGR
jgi:hypothetical protein